MDRGALTAAGGPQKQDDPLALNGLGGLVSFAGKLEELLEAEGSDDFEHLEELLERVHEEGQREGGLLVLESIDYRYNFRAAKVIFILIIGPQALKAPFKDCWVFALINMEYLIFCRRGCH